MAYAEKTDVSPERSRAEIETTLAAARAIEADARARAFWLSVGPNATPERHAKAAAVYAEWQAAKAALDAAAGDP